MVELKFKKYVPQTPSEKRRFPILEVIIVLLIIVIVTQVIIPDYNRERERKFLFEGKQNLQEVQKAVESYWTDTAGEQADRSYPRYLIGGEKNEDYVGENQYQDPLIAKGYLNEYPKNPFVRLGNFVISVQQKLGDPFRPPQNREEAPPAPVARFGERGTLMGNLLGDSRFGTLNDAGFTYHAWDLAGQNQVERSIFPGNFFYKAGPLFRLSPTTNALVEETNVQRYIMGLYGPYRQNYQGLDVLGDELELSFNGGKVKRSLGTSSDGKNGNPYGPVRSGDFTHLSSFQNPNGLPDGIVLILNSNGETLEYGSSQLPQ